MTKNLRDLIDLYLVFDFERGCFVNKVNRGKARVGERAGYIDNRRGYSHIGLGRMHLPMFAAVEQTFSTYSGYPKKEPDNLRHVISYRNLKRPNGQIMVAGVVHPIFVKGEA